MLFMFGNPLVYFAYETVTPNFSIRTQLYPAIDRYHYQHVGPGWFAIIDTLGNQDLNRQCDHFPR